MSPRQFAGLYILIYIYIYLSRAAGRVSWPDGGFHYTVAGVGWAWRAETA